MNCVGAPGAIFVIASIAALATVTFSLRATGRGRAASAAVLLALLSLLSVHLQRGLLELQVVKGVKEGPKLFERWNAFSRVAVTAVSDAVYNISIDGGAATGLFTPEAVQQSLANPGTGMSQAVYRLKTDARVLVIGPGGGFDVASARYYGHQRVTGVEINPIILYLVQERFRAFAGDLYSQPGVQAIHDDGRSFVRRSQERFDIIQLSMVDTWAATGAGWLALTENTLYTVEAFEDYLRHLTAEGIVSVQRWFVPDAPAETLRVVSLGIEALRRQGSAAPAQHFLVWRIGIPLMAEGAPQFAGQIIPLEVFLGTVLIKRTPFDEAEIAHIEALCRQAPQCAMVYAPGRQITNPFTSLLHAPDAARFYKTYPFRVDPTTDDRPFFFYMLKPSQVLTTFSRDFFHILTPDVTDMGLFLLVDSVLITVGLIVVAIALPLWLLGRRQKQHGWGVPIGYFFCLGLGFMCVELAMLQRFTLLVSYPIYSLAVTLAALLVFSGCGSLLTGRLMPVPQKCRAVWASLGVAAMAALYAWLLPRLFDWALPFGLSVRILISVLLLMPVGLLLGMPFPMGIRRLGLGRAGLIPWAWAANGGASVLGSSLALLVALHLGFTAVLMFGASCYCLAWVLFHRWTPVR
jgi:predicted membrane-bound spermidine synthase